ncbi:MAG: HD domain-containing protein [Treponema sp.]|jgi:HD superfamily phosphohydrolase|nr:HD domain-containing protein [Treponema sp.]
MGDDPLAALMDGYVIPVRDALWGHIYLTRGLAALIKSEPFMRLSRILQLGPVYGVYPGATHTRASHSIGVYYLARRILLNLAEQGGAEWLSSCGVHSFLCAGLLHDLGHFPYTHSLKELPLRNHEELTAKIILREPVKSLVAEAGADPWFTAAIVDTGLPASEAGPASSELLFYRRLLSGVLDPDKLDYLNRDARYCGVPYGAQDVDFILSCLHPHPDRGVDIDSRGILSVESILFSKYLMYRAVYWHSAVRSATAMIKKSILGGLNEKLIAPEDLYELDDAGLFMLAASGKDKAYRIMNRSRREYAGRLFSLAEKVRDGQYFNAAAEIPFNASLHQGLRDIEKRSGYEESLAGELSHTLGQRIPPEDIIIDVPEPVIFETGLFVQDENCYFGESSTAFKGEMVRALVDSLQVIRIFIDPSYETKEKSVLILQSIGAFFQSR